jgi:hypothetical protein
MKELLGKLRIESARDTATALLRMPASLRKALRALAVLGQPPDADDHNTAGFVAQLCEAGTPLRLMPPYGALLRSWIAVDGSVGINFKGDGLDEGVAKNLAALSTFSAVFSREQKMAISEAVLHVLSRNGVGTPLAGGITGALRAPATVEEVAAMPAVQAILSVLDKEALLRDQHMSPSSMRLSKVMRTASASLERAHFMDAAGLTLVLWMRNVEAHVFFDSDALPRSGLSSAVVKEVVSAALGVLVEGHGAGYELDGEGVLCRRKAVADVKE